MEENQLVLKFESLLPRMTVYPVEIKYEDHEGFVHSLQSYAYKCMHCHDLFVNPVPCRNQSFYPHDHDCRREEREAVESQLNLCRLRNNVDPDQSESAPCPECGFSFGICCTCVDTFF